MNRIAQGLVLVLLGAAALSSTVVSDLYLNYVQAYFRFFLIGAGVMLVLLGAWLVIAEVRTAAAQDDAGADHEPASACAGGGDGDCHDHSRAPGVAWLLLLPVISVFVIAPPALGSYTASQSSSAAPTSATTEAEEGRYDDALAETDPSEPAKLKLQEFVLRAWTDEERAMAGRPIELTGFVVPHPEGEGWYLARLQISCCAADAVVNRVLITDVDETPEKDSWWTVRGTWVEPEGELQSVRDHRFSVDNMTEVDNPPDPYE
ncbi:TIGR03943 family protein [Nocardiopsis gilva YIM 90087]|uniref:TIGR03943 family protein n=1 Tax=Nocardiopsis gilva YIM 90087 TaxID=1235441 RepID=A0A223S8E3_9ACTN|nr:TIGR03943 family protein [Nocardiopsis gilva]ASU84390.1 TIGR03943 family protein [Nocardiopsis gilva YIM 90087]